MSSPPQRGPVSTGAQVYWLCVQDPSRKWTLRQSTSSPLIGLHWLLGEPILYHGQLLAIYRSAGVDCLYLCGLWFATDLGWQPCQPSEIVDESELFGLIRSALALNPNDRKDHS